MVVPETHVPVAAAPPLFEYTTAGVTVAPDTGVGVVLPKYSSTVTVKVWAPPTTLVADGGVIVMPASAHVLTALAPSVDTPSPVVRVSWIPPTVRVVVACRVVVPTVVELIVTVH